MPLADQRKQYILNRIERDGTVTVTEMAETLNVSEMTIRRDLIELENSGLVRRVHGGAVSARGRSFEPPFLLRVMQNANAKRSIGYRASQLVMEGDSIGLDIGTTTQEMATFLTNFHNLTIITPSLRIAYIFLNQSDIRLILPGGIVRPGEASLVGEMSYQIFQDFYVDKLFLGISNLNAETGLTEFNMEDAQVKKVMMRNAKQVILLADSSKFNGIAFARVSDFNQVHKLVTDAMPEGPLLAKLEEAGVEIILAQGLEPSQPHIDT